MWPLYLILGLWFVNIQHVQCKEEKEILPRIAIVGAGIGGTSAANFLRQLFGPKTQIDVYESTEVGGRAAVVEVNGKKYEAGASIMDEKDKYLVEFAKKFNKYDDRHQQDGIISFGLLAESVTLFRTNEYMFTQSLIKLLWRYGFDIISSRSWTMGILKKLNRIYNFQEKGMAFTTMDELLRAMGEDVFNLTRNSFQDVLSDAGFSETFITELAMAAMRNNFGQTTDVHGLVGAVSFIVSESALWSVRGGNREIAVSLLNESMASLIKAKVVSVSLAKNLSENVNVSYKVKYQTDSLESSEVEYQTGKLKGFEVNYQTGKLENSEVKYKTGELEGSEDGYQIGKFEGSEVKYQLDKSEGFKIECQRNRSGAPKVECQTGKLKGSEVKYHLGKLECSEVECRTSKLEDCEVEYQMCKLEDSEMECKTNISESYKDECQTDKLEQDGVENQTGRSEGSEIETKSQEYDIVVIAAPIFGSKTNISFIDFPNPVTSFSQDYHKLYVMFVQGLLNATTFNLKDNYTPNMLTVSPNLFFNSVRKQSPVDANAEIYSKSVWKTFLNEYPSNEQINKLFDRVTKLKIVDWLAYPDYKANMSMPPFILSDKLYYINAIESAASAMEMSVIGAKNIALLAFNQWHGHFDKIDEINLPVDQAGRSDL